MTNTQEPALGWPFAGELWIGITGASGSNQNPDEDRPFASPSPHDGKDTGIRHHVLIVEDDESDVFLIEEAIGAANLPVTIHVVRDGDQAVQFFDRNDGDAMTPSPALVILDINLPKKRGNEVLKYMRQSQKCGKAFVIAVSTSDSVRDRELMTNLGAHGYFRKPSAYDEFMKLGDMIKALLGETTI